MTVQTNALPPLYMICPAPKEGEAAFMAALARSLDQGVQMLQLRAKGMEVDAFIALAEQVIPAAHARGCKVLLSAEPELVERCGADGLQLDSKRLADCSERPLPQRYLVAASAHNPQELLRAEQLGADFGLLSPVNYTASHPDLEPIGWQRFGEIASSLSVPLFALGGVTPADLNQAREVGGHGIAGTKGMWLE